MTLAVSKPPGLDLPDDFDPRLEKTLCFPRGLSRRQGESPSMGGTDRTGSCGASWAFASTVVASFRECLTLLHQGEQPASLNFFSAQELVSCSAHHGCSGGSAAEAFYYMKQRGIARENCSPYRMRCFHDQSTISMQAGRSPRVRAHNTAPTPRSRRPRSKTPCKCLPSVFHLTSPVLCDLLPAACPKVRTRGERGPQGHVQCLEWGIGGRNSCGSS
ncbi:Tubulointerstitial nephritis antigen (TIN-Ag) [Durusdinium trenchii]|uniref:Tubulointerstitial nephritis antigen (TIN-Ag) n=1 Tax=Durusdinium trenchii TaxID=1381693 RepID=A0ABP0RIE2_9DINO